MINKYLLALIPTLIMGCSGLEKNIKSEEPKEEVVKTCGDYMEFSVGKLNYRMDVFDKGCDGTVDSMNIRFKGNKFPIYYWTDLNGNNKFDNGETYLDIKRDGFNGNELQWNFDIKKEWNL